MENRHIVRRGVSHRECVRCGSKSHTTVQHDKDKKESEAKRAPKIAVKPLIPTNHHPRQVPPSRAKETQGKPTVVVKKSQSTSKVFVHKARTLVPSVYIPLHLDSMILEAVPITHRQLRRAKKSFHGKKTMRNQDVTVEAQLRRVLMTPEQKKQRRLFLRSQTGIWKNTSTVSMVQ